MEHLAEGCRRGSARMSMEVFLNDAGTGLEEMKRISRDEEERGVGAETKVITAG